MANEKRLIDANELTERIKSYAGMFTDELGFVVSLEAVLGGIEFSSTVDAVEVVRCKDCMFNETMACLFSEDNDPKYYDPNWFCADGVRKDNERKAD